MDTKDHNREVPPTLPKSGANATRWVAAKACPRWLPAFALVAVFTLGVTVGIAGDVAYFRYLRYLLLQGPYKKLERELVKFRQQFPLPPEEATKVEAIFRKRHGAAVKRLIDTHQYMMQELEALEADVGSVLGPSKHAKLHEFFRIMKSDLPPGVGDDFSKVFKVEPDHVAPQ